MSARPLADRVARRLATAWWGSALGLSKRLRAGCTAAAERLAEDQEVLEALLRGLEQHPGLPVREVLAQVTLERVFSVPLHFPDIRFGRHVVRTWHPPAVNP